MHERAKIRRVTPKRSGPVANLKVAAKGGGKKHYADRKLLPKRTTRKKGDIILRKKPAVKRNSLQNRKKKNQVFTKTKEYPPGMEERGEGLIMGGKNQPS